jgi:UDP-glucuronate 4-epimerase
MKVKYLVTGVAGFIGSAVCQKLCQLGHDVVGVDNLNDYYSPQLKLARLAHIKHPNFSFIKADIMRRDLMDKLFTEHTFDVVIHLAAQAGVRYSIDNPKAYIDSNLVGYFNIVDCCAIHGISHLVYASSSSVYGLNDKMPFTTNDKVDNPISLYAATKKSNEMIAHSYSHIHQLPVTGLRFFTVYGPWGRPDMALYKFTTALFDNQPIDVYNHGALSRDFTYIDDIVEGVIRVCDKPPQSVDGEAPYKLLNIGAGKPTSLEAFIAAIESATGTKAIRNNLPMQPGDVEATWADTKELEAYINYQPQVGVEEGVGNFVRWFKQYHR